MGKEKEMWKDQIKSSFSILDICKYFLDIFSNLPDNVQYFLHIGHDIWVPAPRCAALFCTLPFDWLGLWVTALLLCRGLQEVLLGLLILLDNLVILG